MAFKLSKFNNENRQLSTKWYYKFLKRWDKELKLVKPRKLTSNRAAALTTEDIDRYFEELERVMTKYGLQDKPQLIYNLDETGLQPEHRPPLVISHKAIKNTQSITSPNSTTVTMISCINAAGTTLPPYYVFKGKLENKILLKRGSTWKRPHRLRNRMVKWGYLQKIP